MQPRVFESWGKAVMNCNYEPFKRVTGERELARVTRPCGRSVCSGCQTNCEGRITQSSLLRSVA